MLITAAVSSLLSQAQFGCIDQALLITAASLSCARTLSLSLFSVNIAALYCADLAAFVQFQVKFYASQLKRSLRCPATTRTATTTAAKSLEALSCFSLLTLFVLLLRLGLFDFACSPSAQRATARAVTFE